MKEMQVDSVGVKEQPKLKKVRNIIIIFITRTIQTDYQNYHYCVKEQPKLTMIGFDNGDHYVDDNSENIMAILGHFWAISAILGHIWVNLGSFSGFFGQF